MELHEFITQTLVQISQGIENASEELKDSSAIVNPKNVNYNRSEHIQAYGWLSDTKERLRAVQSIDFDVTVTVTEGKENKGGIGVAIGNVGLGSQRKSGSENIAQNKIKFRVPMVLPNEQKSTEQGSSSNG